MLSKSFRFVSLICILISSLVFSPATVTQAQGISLPAQINKSFTPISIPSGGTSTLSVSIFNPNSFALTLSSTPPAWTDDLSTTGITFATPLSPTTTCGGTVSAVGTTLSLIGGTVPAQAGVNPGSCTVTVKVTSAIAGNHVNTIPANVLKSTDPTGTIPVTNTTPASATLEVNAVQSPSVSKSFTSNTVWVGQTSQLAIVIRNNDLNAPLTQASLSDTLPANVVLANLVSPTLTNCGGAASLTAISGSNSVVLNNSTLAPNSSCTIRVNVVSTVAGAYTNTIPANALHTHEGPTNGSPANAPLNVRAVGLSKAFLPASFQAGGTSTLTITLQNPTGSPYTGVNLSDTLPGTILTVVNGSAATTCGGTAVATQPRTVSLTGGTIPAGSVTTPGTCTITVQVTAPTGATAATFTNTIPAGALTTAQPGVTNVQPATAQVRVIAAGTGVTGSKNFTPATIAPGGNSRLRININAPADTGLSNFTLHDALPAGVTISNSTAASLNANCGVGAVLTAVTGANSISLTGGTIPAGTTCQINVFVTSNTENVYTNTIRPVDITDTQNRTLANNITANLTVRVPNPFSMSKVFTPATVIPGGLSTLTISLQNTDASALVNVSLTDTLPGTTTNGVIIAPTPNASTTCSGGIVTAAAGTQIITMTGGTIPAQVGGVPGLCTITVDVLGQGAGATRTNTIPVLNVSGTIQGTTTTVNPGGAASASLTIANLSIDIVKGFEPLTVFGGSASTMSVQLLNPNNVALTGIAFTDSMPAGMIIANPANPSVGTCGGTLTGTAGAGTFSFSGGSLPARGSCTLTLSVTMTVNGNLTNDIPAGAVRTASGATNPDPADASLTNLPGASVSKFFSPNTIAAGGISTLTITIQNTSAIPLDGMGLADILPGTLPAGLEVANPPSAATNCSDPGHVPPVTPIVTANVGSQNVQLANGSLAANASCTIAVSVTSSTPGSYLNTIPAGALSTGQGASNTLPASDTLTVTGAATAALGDFVWNDTNANGIQDAGEAGIPNVTVNLLDNTGTVVGTTTTDASGLYHFTNLTPATYSVEFVPPAGFVVSPANQGANDAVDSDADTTTGRTGTYTLAAGETNNTVDAGLHQPATAALGDFVWDDVNANGIQDAGEAGIPGVTVNLLNSGGAVIGTTTTDANGLYHFTNLAPGTYSVEFVPPAGYAVSPANQGADDAADSDANITTGRTGNYTLAAGETNNTVDAGLHQTAALGDFVWNDVNADGIQDTGEAGIPNVTVNLLNNVGTIIATTTTDANGLYHFTNLTPGTYRVEFVPPAGYVVSPANQGADDAADSDVNTVTGQTGDYTLAAGETNNTVDAGLHQPVNQNGLTKIITDTSQSFTSGTQVAIGEIVTYQTSVPLAPGTYNIAQLIDTMDQGLAFVNCLSIAGPGLNTSIAGGFASVCNNPTVETIPNGSADPADVDRRATFDFGTLTNNGNGLATLTVTYRAVVIDSAGNLDGVSLNNSVAFAWAGGNLGPASEDVQIVEPKLSIAKTSDNPFVAVGSDLAFTLTLEHTSASKTDAFDVTVTDPLPVYLDFVPGSLNCTTGAQVPTACTYDTPTRTVTATWSTFTLSGGNGVIQFHVVPNSLPAGSGAITNVAKTAWSSLPGDVSAPQSPNTLSTERFYDPLSSINVYGASTSLTLTPLGSGSGGGASGRGSVRGSEAAAYRGAVLIPITGFAPGKVTDMSGMPVTTYDASSNLTLEIPTLKLRMPIVGVALSHGVWDVNWLLDRAGWLEQTAFPTFTGNSVVTGHVTLSNGDPGPFARLSTLSPGDLVFVHAFGQLYIYQVRSLKTVRPDDISIFRHQDKAWLTLVTCGNYDATLGAYLNRTVVGAELIGTQPDLYPGP